VSQYCSLKEVQADAAKGGSTYVAPTAIPANAACTHVCSYPLELDSRAMYSNLPLAYDPICGHHVNSKGNIPEPVAQVV